MSKNSLRMTTEQYKAIVARQVKQSEAIPAEIAKQSKYKNVKTVVDGVRFDSKKEAKQDAELVLREQAGEIRSLERQVNYPLIVNGERLGAYRADWTYWEGERFVVRDAKGYHTPVYRLKKKLMKALYDVEILES